MALGAEVPGAAQEVAPGAVVAREAAAPGAAAAPGVAAAEPGAAWPLQGDMEGAGQRTWSSFSSNRRLVSGRRVSWRL